MSIQEDPIIKEILRRYDIIDSQPVEALRRRMLTSRLYFTAHRALIGYLLSNRPEWLDQDCLTPIMDEYTFHSGWYDPLIYGLHSQLVEKIDQKD